MQGAARDDVKSKHHSRLHEIRLPWSADPCPTLEETLNFRKNFRKCLLFYNLEANLHLIAYTFLIRPRSTRDPFAVERRPLPNFRGNFFGRVRF